MTADKNPIIELKQFEKWYGNVNAIKPLDLTILEGETFVFLGPNGSGKSTIIRSLAGLHFATKGQILINGIDINSHLIEVKKLFSYMPQRVTLPDHLTAREVITLYANLRKVDIIRVEEMLEFVELKESADRYINEFSGGMLQRIGLAIAFLGDAQIYILDEPTLNLDPLGISRLHELILELKEKGKTFLFASHILQDAIQLADRVGILVDGNLAGIEPISMFRQSIAFDTTVRIKLSTPLDDIQSIIEKVGAENVDGNGRTFTFKAEPNQRLSVIQAIETAGGNIEEFHTDPPNWETLLHHHLNSNKDD